MDKKPIVILPPKPEKVIDTKVQMGRVSRNLNDKVKRHQHNRAVKRAHEVRVQMIKLSKVTK